MASFRLSATDSEGAESADYLEFDVSLKQITPVKYKIIVGPNGLSKAPGIDHRYGGTNQHTIEFVGGDGSGLLQAFDRDSKAMLRVSSDESVLRPVVSDVNTLANAQKMMFTMTDSPVKSLKLKFWDDDSFHHENDGTYKDYPEEWIKGDPASTDTVAEIKTAAAAAVAADLAPIAEGNVAAFKAAVAIASTHDDIARALQTALGAMYTVKHSAGVYTIVEHDGPNETVPDVVTVGVGTVTVAGSFGEITDGGFFSSSLGMINTNDNDSDRTLVGEGTAKRIGRDTSKMNVADGHEQSYTVPVTIGD